METPTNELVPRESFVGSCEAHLSLRSTQGITSTSISEKNPVNDTVRLTVAVSSNSDPTFLLPSTRRQQYTILAVGWLVTFQITGLSQAYGVFQSFHSDHIGDVGALINDEGANQRGAVALIGALSSSSISLMLGILMTPILDKTKPKKWYLGERSGVTYLMAGGAVFLWLGYLLAAFATKLWQLVLAHGIVVGLGGALLYYPVQTISSEYFHSRRALAAGFIASGASVGGLFYAPIIHLSISRFGIRNTYHALATSSFIVSLALALLTPPPRPTLSDRKFLPTAVWKRSSFYLMVIAGLVYQMVLNQPTIFGPDFTRTLDHTPNFASLWLAVMNGIGAPTRFGLGWVGDRAGRQGTLIATQFIAVLSALSWLASSLLGSKAFFWLFTITYGSMAAGFNQFMGPVLLDVFGSEVFFSVNAAVSFSRGIGSLLGTPIGGALLGSREGRKDVPRNYSGLAAFTASMFMVMLLCCSLVWLKSRRRRRRELL